MNTPTQSPRTVLESYMKERAPETLLSWGTFFMRKLK